MPRPASAAASVVLRSCDPDGRLTRQDALVALVQAEPPAAHTAFERFTAEGPLALLPFAGRHALVWSMRPERASALAQEFDQRRRAFYARVAPILVMLMDRYQAKAIFDETSVLLADQSLNITDEVIAEIDARAAETAPEAAPEGEPAAPSPPEGTDGGE